MVDREVVGRLDLAAERGHDARRDRVVEAERIADRDDGVAHPQHARVAERERVELEIRRVDLDHGEVGREVLADELRRHRVALAEAHLDVLGAVHHVRVRGDVAIAVQHERRPIPRGCPW